MAGRLVMVATPIGNLGDLSPRAVEALADADVVACEDTRRTGKLLAHAGVNAPRLLVVNEHTEAAGAAEIAELVAGGNTVVLVSDAGTPAVSDPGSRVVKAVLDAGGEVEAVPGPSAALSALVVSGLPTGRFCFEGFLPERVDIEPTASANWAKNPAPWCCSKPLIGWPAHWATWPPRWAATERWPSCGSRPSCTRRCGEAHWPMLLSVSMAPSLEVNTSWWWLALPTPVHPLCPKSERPSRRSWPTDCPAGMRPPQWPPTSVYPDEPCTRSV